MANEEEDLRRHDYIGPVSQQEKPVHADVVAHGRDTGCVACTNASKVNDLGSYISTRYVAMGVQHEHVYKNNLPYIKD